MHRVCTLGKSLVDGSALPAVPSGPLLVLHVKRDLGYRNFFSSCGTASFSEQGIFASRRPTNMFWCEILLPAPSFLPLGPYFCDSSTPMAQVSEQKPILPCGEGFWQLEKLLEHGQVFMGPIAVKDISLHQSPSRDKHRSFIEAFIIASSNTKNLVSKTLQQPLQTCL
jgi:hypothetical protein